MGAKTGIEWTDSTWSPLRVRVRQDAAEIARAKGYESLVSIGAEMAGRVGQHCEHVSAGCEHCYAEGMQHRRLPSNGTGLPYDRRSRDLVECFVDEKELLKPLKWKPIYTTNGQLGTGRWEYVRPRRIFAANQSDLFGEWVTDEQLDRFYAVAALCPQHIIQVLTKRPERRLAYLTATGRTSAIYNAAAKIIGGDFSKMPAAMPHHRSSGEGWWPLPNVWEGVSVEDQKTADERIPLLLRTPAAVRFVSYEPALGPMDLTRIPSFEHRDGDAKQLTGLDWVICGGESGPKARPMHPDWARGVRDQCAAAGVPFFFKQWGEWTPGENVEAASGFLRSATWFDGQWLFGEETLSRDDGHVDDEPDLYRVGKKAAGALLDGVEHKAFPDAGGVRG